jgi:hypothetical protein
MPIAGIGLDDCSGVIALPSRWRAEQQHHKIMTFSGRARPAQLKELSGLHTEGEL